MTAQHGMSCADTGCHHHLKHLEQDTCRQGIVGLRDPRKTVADLGSYASWRAEGPFVVKCP